MPVVGVNLLWLVPGVVGGSEEYTLRLLRGIEPGRSDDLRIRLYGQQGLLDTHPDLGERFEFRVLPNLAAKQTRIVAENTWLAAVSRKDDLVHYAGGVLPLVRRAPAVLTVHDLQPFDMPEHFSPLKRRWLGWMVPRSVRASVLTLVPSEFSSDRVQALIGVDASRLRVVPHGLDPQPVGLLDPAADARLRARFGRYLLLPAIAYPHKRHADLVRALHGLRERFPDLSVVFTGRSGPETTALESLTTELGLDGRVHHLGRVDEQELDSLYRSAAAMVFPSAYEGFGNPVVEAMARGCPVIASDAGALPAVAGSAAVIVPVGDIGALGDAIASVLGPSTLRARLMEAGPERAARFSGSAAAERLVECYRQALREAG